MDMDMYTAFNKLVTIGEWCVCCSYRAKVNRIDDGGYTWWCSGARRHGLLDLAKLIRSSIKASGMEELDYVVKYINEREQTNEFGPVSP